MKIGKGTVGTRHAEIPPVGRDDRTGILDPRGPSLAPRLPNKQAIRKMKNVGDSVASIKEV